MTKPAQALDPIPTITLTQLQDGSWNGGNLHVPPGVNAVNFHNSSDSATVWVEFIELGHLHPDELAVLPGQTEAAGVAHRVTTHYVLFSHPKSSEHRKLRRQAAQQYTIDMN